MPRAAVMPGTKLQEHSGSEKAWVYTTVDFADEEQKPELFCIRFASPESEPPAALALPAACAGIACLSPQQPFMSTSCRVLSIADALSRCLQVVIDTVG